jgi:nucleoside-triphosphatase THEP1
MREPRIVLLTGERQIGKSTLCGKLAQRLAHAGYQVSGLLTRRTGFHDLEVTELHTGQTYPLTRPFDPNVNRPLGNFIFSPDAVERSNQAFQTCFPTQVFILDELGPLEFVHQKGWASVIPMIAHEVYGLAVMVVRPELLTQAMDAFAMGYYAVIYVRQENRDTLPDSVYHYVKHKLKA